MARYAKASTRAPASAPHRVAVTRRVRTAWGLDRQDEVLPTVYPNQAAARIACRELVNLPDVLQAQPVVA